MRMLVTGVGRGIGRALAEEALARGHDVIGTTRDGTSPVAHARFRAIPLDVTDDASVRAAAAALDGPLDALVNNAGVFGPRDQAIDRLDPADLLQVLDVNVAGPVRVLQAFLPHLERAGEAKVLMVSSGIGRFSGGGSGAVAYRASKAALNKIAQTLATDLAGRGVRVAACHPGWVRTDMGGQGADIAPADSARGLLDRLEALGPAESGRFFDWNGAARDW